MKIPNWIAPTRRKGASGMEFGLVVGLVAVVAVAATATVGGKVREIFGGTTNAMALGLDGSLGSGSVLNLAAGVTAPTAPVISTTSLPNAGYGSVYSQSVSVAGQNGDAVSWSLASGSLPLGMSLNAVTGSIIGSSVSVGSSPFSVRATDTVNGMSSTQALSIAVVASPPTVSTSSLPSATQSWPYSQTLSASDPQSLALTWSISSGTLPSGIVLAPGTGVVSGTAASSGSFPVSFIVSDSAGAASPPLSLTFVVSAAGGVTCSGMTSSSGNGSVHGNCLFATPNAAAATVSVAGGPASLSFAGWGGGGAGGAVSAAAVSGQAFSVYVGGGGQSGDGGNAGGGGGATYVMSGASPVLVLGGGGGASNCCRDN